MMSQSAPFLLVVAVLVSTSLSSMTVTVDAFSPRTIQSRSTTDRLMLKSILKMASEEESDSGADQSIEKKIGTTFYDDEVSTQMQNRTSQEYLHLAAHGSHYKTRYLFRFSNTAARSIRHQLSRGYPTP